MSQPKENLRQAAQGKGVPTEVRKALRQAADLNWYAMPRNKRGFWAVSPDGTERFYIPITIRDEKKTARDLLAAMNKWTLRGIDEKFGTTHDAEDKALLEHMPTCPTCGRQFPKWSMANECHTQHVAADLPLEEEPVSNTMSADVGTMSAESTEEEEKVDPEIATPKVGRNAGAKHPTHSNWQTVDDGLARDLYTAMRARSQGNMPLSSYANILAQDIRDVWAGENRLAWEEPARLLNEVRSLLSDTAEAEARDSETVRQLEEALATSEANYEEMKARAEEAEGTLAAAADLFTPKK